MTKKKIIRFDTLYQKEIIWLQWYFKRDKTCPKNTILQQMIIERRLEVGDNQDTILAKYTAIQKALDAIVQRTDEDVLLTIKEVYVYRSMNIIGACNEIMHLSETPVYIRLRKWFKEFSDEVFNPEYYKEQLHERN